MTIFRGAVFGLALTLSTVSWGNAEGVSAKFDKAYFTIGSIEHQEVSETEEDAAFMHSYFLFEENVAEDNGGWVGKIANPSKIVSGVVVNLGKQVWKIIEANRPVANFTTDTAHAVPQGTRHWSELEGWNMPSSRVFHLSYKNAYGAKVVDFSYRVLYTYGGSFDGKGKYLTNVTIVPAKLTVAWGYTFNAQAAVPSVTNAGTRADPIGAAELQLKWSVDTVLKHKEASMSYYVRGDGFFADLSDGTK